VEDKNKGPQTQVENATVLSTDQSSTNKELNNGIKTNTTKSSPLTGAKRKQDDRTMDNERQTKKQKIIVNSNLNNNGKNEDENEEMRFKNESDVAVSNTMSITKKKKKKKKKAIKKSIVWEHVLKTINLLHEVVN